MKTINAVKFKNNSSFEKTRVKSNVLQVHEPFNIVVFEDQEHVEPDLSKVKQTTSIPNLEQIPSGLAILVASDYKKAEIYLKTQKIDVIDKYDSTGTFIVDIPDHLLFDDFRNSLLDKGLFISITEDKITENKSDYTNYPYSAHWWLGNINAAAAWAQLPVAGLVDVAVIDGDGCEIGHPDLVGKTNANWNCVNNTNNVLPISDNEKHGTPCAGIIAANCANNQLVLSAGNDRVRVQFLKVGYNHTSTGSWNTSDAIMTMAVNKAITNTACVAISMSFRTSSSFTGFKNALVNAKANGRGGKGIPLFASSGNDGTSLFTQAPAAWPEVMAIGSSNSINTRSSFSNYGTNLFAAAPGSSVLTTDRTGGKGYSVNIDPSQDAVTYFSGTSAACPVMAGVAATMILANPSLTESQVRTILAQTSRKLGGYIYTSGKSLELGYGIVDQNAAVAAAINNVPSPALPNVTMIMSAQGTATQGTIIPINYTVSLSVAQTSAITLNVSFYRSLDGVLAVNDTMIQTEVITIPASTTMYTSTFNFTVPTNIVGNVYVIGFVDSNNILSEPIEIDNTANVVINVVTTGPVPINSGLDLAVQILQYRYNNSGKLYVKQKFTNTGSVAITSYKFVRGFIGGTQQTKTINNINMQPGQTVTTETVWNPVPPSYPGTYRITITGVNGIVDSIATNNVSTIQVNQP